MSIHRIEVFMSQKDADNLAVLRGAANGKLVHLWG
jgi:hypothetical protein